LRDGIGLVYVAMGLFGIAEVLSIFGSECGQRSGLHFHGQDALLCELIDPATEKPLEGL
jgi:phenylacetate-coenzyme A ligase PaaK-like adenylate-forming protein